METSSAYLLKTLNLPEPKAMSFTKYGCSKPKNPPPSPSNICVDNNQASPASFQKMMSAHRTGSVNSPARKRGFRPHPLFVMISPAYVAPDMVNWASTIAPAISGMAERFTEPSSLSPPINSPSTRRTLALAKLHTYIYICRWHSQK